jgi:hypothetical protein
MNGKKECIKDFVVKAKRKQSTWEDNKMDLREIKWVVRIGLIWLRIGTSTGLL